MDTQEYIITVSKKQMALMMNISNTTLRSYLNVEWYDELQHLGYHRNSKVLTPRQILFIQSKWGRLNFNLLNTKLTNTL
jgi:hypothetical protein